MIANVSQTDRNRIARANRKAIAEESQQQRQRQRQRQQLKALGYLLHQSSSSVTRAATAASDRSQQPEPGDG